MTTPLIRELKSNFPKAKLSVLTFQSHKDIIGNNSDIDEVIAFDFKYKSNIFKILVLIFELRKRHFDISICAYPSGLRSALVGYLSGAKERFGQGISLFKNYRWLFTKQTPITEVKHAILMNLDFLKLLDIDLKDINTKLILNLFEEDKKFVSEFLKGNGVEDGDLLIAVHAGGGKFTTAYRNWPAERFAKVADELIEKFSAKIVFIGGENDEATVNGIIRMMKQRPISAAGKISLKQTSALIKRAKLLVCNNSAPMHIAAALGIPTVSIFGSADPRIHKPWGEGHLVLQKQLECSPCYYPLFMDTLEETKLRNRWVGNTFKCKTDDYRCLTSISVEEVMEAVESILKVKSTK